MRHAGGREKRGWCQMESLPRTSRAPSLTASEREVVAVYSDADRTWYVYSDSATMRGAILRLARRIGVEIRRVGSHGVEFEAPAATLRLTAKRRSRGNPGNLRRTLKSARQEAAAEGKVGILDGPPGRDVNPVVSSG